jgi:hypothetical protein
MTESRPDYCREVADCSLRSIEPVPSLGYSESLDAASPDSVQLSRLSASSEGDESALKFDAIQEPGRRLKELSGLEIDKLRREAEGASVGLKKDELATVLLNLGLKHNYGIPPGTAATREQIGAFWRGLQLPELALAHACALGRDAAWQQFIARFREPLTQTRTANQRPSCSRFVKMHASKGPSVPIQMTTGRCGVMGSNFRPSWPKIKGAQKAHETAHATA